MPGVLITRMHHDVCATVRRIRAQRLHHTYHFYMQPLLWPKSYAHEALHKALTSPLSMQSLFIFTSRLGILFLQHALQAAYASGQLHPSWNNITQSTALCVGRSTAAYARDYGFKTVITGQESAQSLLDCNNPVIHQAYAQAKAIMHISGYDTHTHITHMLKTQYPAYPPSQRLIVYKTVPTHALRPCVLRAFHYNRIQHILLYSQKSAQTLSHIMPHIPKTTHIYGLSSAINQVFSYHPSSICQDAGDMLKMLG